MYIKKRIIERVNEINDPQLLDELFQATELEHKIEHFHQLSSDDKIAIDKGIEDAESNHLHSSSKAKILVKKWAKK